MNKSKIKNTIVAFSIAAIITLGGTASEAALGDRPLYQGVRHNDVVELQQGLKDLSYFTQKNTTTYFGNVTKQAVLKFQKANGLATDGSFGPNSVKVLKQQLKKAAKPVAAPSRSDAGKSTSINIVNTAKKFLGSRYVYGGSSPSGFDCSGFTSYVYKQAGIRIPRATTGQAGAGTKISKSALQPGDLLIFSNTYKAGPSHAGVYIGNGQFIHASTPSKGVRTDSINSNYYSGKFSYGRRVY